MEKPIRISDLNGRSKEKDKVIYKHDEILIKNCLKVNLRNSLNCKEKELLRCNNKCQALLLVKKYQNELKEIMEANINLKKINEILINSLNLKDNMYLELRNKNKDLKADCNFLQYQIASKNKFYSVNDNFNSTFNIFHDKNGINNNNPLGKFQGTFLSPVDNTKNFNNKFQNNSLFNKQNLTNLNYNCGQQENTPNENLKEIDNLNFNVLHNIKSSEISNSNNNEVSLFSDKLKKQKNPNTNLFNKTSHTRHASLGSLASNINNSNSRNIYKNNNNLNVSNNKSLATSSINYRNKSNENYGIINSKGVCEKVKLTEINETSNIKNNNLNINLQTFVNNNGKDSFKTKNNNGDEIIINDSIDNNSNNNKNNRLNFYMSPERNEFNKEIDEDVYNKNDGQSFFKNLKKENANIIAEDMEFFPTNKCLIGHGCFDSTQINENKYDLTENEKIKNSLFSNLNSSAIKNRESFSNNSRISYIKIKNKNCKTSERNYNPVLEKSSTYINNKVIKKTNTEETDKLGYSQNFEYSKCDLNNNYYLNDSNNDQFFSNINNKNIIKNNNANNNSKMLSYYEKLSKLNSKNSIFRVYSNPEKSLLSLSEAELNDLISNEDFKKARKISASVEHFTEFFRENSEQKLMQISDKYFSIISDFEAAISLIKKLKKFVIFISHQSNFLLIEEIADLIIKSIMDIFDCEKARIYMFDSMTNVFHVFESSCFSSSAGKNYFNNNLNFGIISKNLNSNYNPRKNNNKIQKKNEIISEIFLRGNILRLNNSANNERFFKDENKSDLFTAENMLFCPLKETESSPSFGVLQLLNKKNSVFANDDEELIKIFSMQISRILLNAKNNNESNSYLGKFKFMFSLQKKFENVKNIFDLEFEIRNTLAALFSSEYSQFLFYNEAFTQNLFKISKNQVNKINKSIGIIGFVFTSKEYFGVSSTNDCQIFNNLTDIETGLTLLTYPILVKNEVKAIIQFSYNEKLAYFKKPKEMDEILIGSLLNECERWLVNNEKKIIYDDFKKVVQLENALEEEETTIN